MSRSAALREEVQRARPETACPALRARPGTACPALERRELASSSTGLPTYLSCGQDADVASPPGGGGLPSGGAI
eukprot:12142602-Heterocapsa_arctica.AAC.1